MTLRHPTTLHARGISHRLDLLPDDFRADSDVDVLVEFLPGHPPDCRFITIEREFSELLHGRRVDMVTPTFLGPRIRDKVLGAAEPLHGAA
ncbi:MAG: nucleotidyltransferase [Acidobacteriota bacterium]